MELNKRVGFGLLGQRPRSPENVMTTTVRELYASPNGDRWALARNGDGELVVCHQPNRRPEGWFLKSRSTFSCRMAGKDPNITPSPRHSQNWSYLANILTIARLTQK